MRRLLFVVFAVFAAASVVSFTSLSASAQSGEQYEPSDGAEVSASPPESEASSEASSEDQSGTDFISQGIVTGERSQAAAEAARKDLNEEEQLPDYSQVVDNTTKGAFRAEDWKLQRGGLAHGGDFVVAEGSKAKPARFEVKIPTTNDYAVYAWWSPSSKNSPAARFGIATASGVKWTEADQRNEGGMWLKLGTYEMKKGQRSIQVSASPSEGGDVIADAVAVVRGDLTAPPEEEAASPSTSASEARITSDSRSRSTGRDVVRQARRHLGTPYGHSRCRINVQEDCTCHTKLVFKRFGYSLPDMPGQQYRYGQRVAKSNLRPGDLVFFDDTGDGRLDDAHDGVGIYSGGGWYINGNSYFGKVVEKEMKWRKGYFGAKRLRLR